MTMRRSWSGFMRYVAKGPDCGRSWSNLAAVDDNREYAEFGCALTANIAAQLGNPADLVNPRAADDAERRAARDGDGQVPAGRDHIVAERPTSRRHARHRGAMTP